MRVRLSMAAAPPRGLLRRRLRPGERPTGDAPAGRRLDQECLPERRARVEDDLGAVASDRDLVEALKLREPSATETLVMRYGERAYRLAIRITGNGPDAEEVVQDAFWTVVRKIERNLAGPTGASRYFHLIARVQ